MAVSFVQAASANANSVAFSSTLAGDVIVVMAYNNASTTIPTVPGGYTSLQSGSAIGEAGVIGSKVSAGGETSTGTWTNATNIVVLIYRGSQGTGATGTPATGNSVSVSYPTLTLQNASGSSWVAGLAGAKAATAGMNGTTAALTQNRTNQTTVNGLDTNGGVTSFAAQTLTVTTSGRWIGFSVEILAAGIPAEDSEVVDSDAVPGTPSFLSCLAIGVLSAAMFSSGVAANVAVDKSGFDYTQPYCGSPNFQSPQVLLGTVNGVNKTFTFAQPPGTNFVITVGGRILIPGHDVGLGDYTSVGQTVTFSVAPTQTPLVYGCLYGLMDEDYWGTPLILVPVQGAMQVPLTAQPQMWDNDLIIPKLDEDYWVSNVVPIAQVFYQPLPLLVDGSASDLPPPQFVADEDVQSALNVVQPATLFVNLQQWQFEQQEFASTFDEDYWQGLSTYVTPPVSRLYAADALDQDFTSFPTDEDFWLNPVAAVPATLVWPQQWAFEQHEDTPQYDEDYWQNSVVPVAASLSWPQPFIFESEYIQPYCGSPNFQSPQWLSGVVDGSNKVFTILQAPGTNFVITVGARILVPGPDYTVSGLTATFAVAPTQRPVIYGCLYLQSLSSDGQPGPVVVVQPLGLQYVFSGDDLPAFAFVPDEDVWLNPVAPSQAANQPLQQFSFDQADLQSQVTVDEDLWQQAILPVTASWWPQPFTWDSGSAEFASTFDEDYWQSLVPPQLAALYQTLPYLPDATDVLPTAFDEDFWQNGVAPIAASLIWPQQWIFDQQEPSLFGPEEDLWQNPVAPVSATLQWFQQFSLDQPEVELLSVDEDYWQNPVGPVPATLQWLQQWPFDGQESFPVFTADEDFWISGVAPVQASFIWPQQWAFEQQEDTPQYDEDYWQSAVAPVPASLIFPQQSIFDVQEPSLFGPEEDLWQVVLPQLTGQIYPQPFSFDQPEFVFTPDEDFWQSAVVPVVASLAWPQPFIFDQQEVVFSPEEDFWSSGIAPVVWANIWAQPSIFDVQEPAGSLSGQPDEDFWQNPVAPVVATLAWPQQFAFDESERIPPGFIFPDEDFWQNPVAPIPATLQWPQQWTFDVQEPAGKLFGEPEEDFWQNPTPPVWWLNTYPQQWTFDSQDSQLYTPFEEDAWQPYLLVQQAGQLIVQQFALDQSETVARVDEDYWQNAVVPAAASLQWPQPFGFDQPEFVFSPDEDYWQGLAPIAPASLYQALPYLPDGQDFAVTQQIVSDEDVPLVAIQALIGQNYPQQFGFDQQDFVLAQQIVSDEDVPLVTAPKLIGQVFPQPFIFDQQEVISQFDEDFWQNPVAPQVWAQPVAQQWPFDVQEPGNLSGQPDEDYWQNWVVPIAASLQWPQQWIFDSQDPQPFGAEEDFWTNPVAPVPAALAWVQPFTWDSGSAEFSSTFDEDYWQNPVTPVAASNYQSLPLLPETGVDVVVFPLGPEEDYWQNPVAPVQAVLYQRLPYLPDPENIWSPIAPAQVMILARIKTSGEMQAFKLSSYGQMTWAKISTRVAEMIEFKIEGLSSG